MHNGVSAASGLTGNDMRQGDRIRHLIIALGGETVRVGQAQGYKLEDIAGQDAEKLARASEGYKGALEEVEALMLALRNSPQRGAAPVDGPGHAEKAAHRDRLHQRRHRRARRGDQPQGVDPSEADHGGEAGRARQGEAEPRAALRDQLKNPA